jgi:hypothetical protein
MRAREPSWRAEAVRSLIDMYWVEMCEPDNPDHYDGEATPEAQRARRERQWERVFVPLGIAGVWEILFPTKAEADSDAVLRVRERFFLSEIPGHAMKGRWEAAIHEAAIIRASLE